MRERTAWAASEEALLLEESRVSALVGRRIAGGRYFEIDYPDHEPTWDGPDFHALDFGLELDFDDGATWSFVWKQLGQNEALLAYEGVLVGDQLVPDGAFGIWPIAEVARWQELIGADIVGIASVWEDFGEDLCPLTWTLELGTGACIVLTLGTREDGGFRGSADDVAIFFDLATAARLGAILPGRTDGRSPTNPAHPARRFISSVRSKR